MSCVVDIATEVFHDPERLDDLLDPLYLAGFMAKDGFAPRAQELLGSFLSVYSTSPAFLLVNSQERTLSLASYDSPTANRMLSQARGVSFEQAQHWFNDGYFG